MKFKTSAVVWCSCLALTAVTFYVLMDFNKMTYQAAVEKDSLIINQSTDKFSGDVVAIGSAGHTRNDVIESKIASDMTTFNASDKSTSEVSHRRNSVDANGVSGVAKGRPEINNKNVATSSNGSRNVNVSTGTSRTRNGTSRERNVTYLPTEAQLLQALETRRHHRCNNQQASYIAIAVQTAIQSRDIRDAIRSSWGEPSNLLKYNASLYFFMGKPADEKKQGDIDTEKEQHHDVIQLNLIDSYYNLSLKSIESIRWVNKHCGGDVKYVIKQDDDTFVNLTQLRDVLQRFERENKTEFITGRVRWHSKVVRNTGTAFDISYEAWNGTSWPPACTGPAYVISNNVIRRLLHEADNYGAPFILYEDMFITGVLRQKADIPILNIKAMKHPRCNAAGHNMGISYHRVYAENHRNLFHQKPCIPVKKNMRV